MKSRVAFIGFAILTLALSACKNSCNDVSCLNNGTCVNGTCECAFRYGGKFCDTLCPVGYDGERCDQLMRNKFIHQWSAVTTVSSGGTTRHVLYITAGSTPAAINIVNFNNEGFTVIGTVSGKDNFDIVSQNATGSYTGLVSGYGYLNGSKLAINLSKENGANYFANCNR